MNLNDALTYARVSCGESAAEHEHLSLHDAAQQRRIARDELRESHAVLVASPLLLAALKAYQKAGYGNSTDIVKQHQAYMLAVAALEQAEG